MNENTNTSDPATAAQLVVCEKTGKWASALRRELGRQFADRLFETRLLEHCIDQLTAFPRSVVALEQTWNNYDSVFSLLDRIAWSFPMARAIVLDTTRDLQLSRMDQVAGAIHVTTSRLNLRHAARLIGRHLDRFQSKSSQFEEMLRRLPWRDED